MTSALERLRTSHEYNRKDGRNISTVLTADLKLAIEALSVVEKYQAAWDAGDGIEQAEQLVKLSDTLTKFTHQEE